METGKLIQEHILINQDCAKYGEQVLTQLSKDLLVSHNKLFCMHQFSKEYPIFQPAAKLSWSHYQKLLSVNDQDQYGRYLIEVLVEGKWIDRELIDSEYFTIRGGE